MNRAIAWFAENHVAANLLMLLLVVGGLSALPTIPQLTFPDIVTETITITVEYRGAAPEEVETGVCVRIEEEIDGIDGIERIRSVAAEGACTVSAELLVGADTSRVLDDVKNRVDAITTFPDETEEPIIAELLIRRAAIDVAVAGDVDERTLRVLGEQVRDEIARLPGVTQVELNSARPYEISVEVPERALRRHGLSFDQVVQAVRRSSLDLPGGSIKTGGGEILLRSKGQAYRGSEFEELVLITHPDGTRVQLGDVASVVDGFEETDQRASFNGKPAVLVRVYRTGEQDLIEITDAVKAWVEEAQARVPEGIELSVWRDSSTMLRGRLDTLLRNGRSGFLLVFAVLALFLRLRLAAWVSLGVPIAFCGGLFAMPALGMTINAISLFAFILVLGILVDDAIVVGESIHRRQQEIGDRLRGAIEGTQAVAVPVVFGVLTTIATFVPMLLIPGFMGQVFEVMATVVIACLVFSVIESQFVLPAHLGHGGSTRFNAPSGRWVEGWRRVQTAVASGLERFIDRQYRVFLERALAWRYLTVATAVAFLMMTVGVIASGRMNFSFFPPLEADYVSGLVTMPLGTPVEETERAVRQLERAAVELQARLDAELGRGNGDGTPSVIRHRFAAVGEQPSTTGGPQGQTNSLRLGSAHLGEVTLELVPGEERDISTAEVADRWRELTGSVPDAVELVFSSDLFSAGDAIAIQLRGANVDHLRQAAERLKLQLAEYPGTRDIADSFRAGKREIELAILPSAEALGLTLQDLARQVRQAFYGEEAQRVQRGRDDIRVMVRYPADDRRSLGDLENMRIRAPDGVEVPFRAVARAELGRGYSTIRRTDRLRVVDVTADVDRSQTTAGAVLADLAEGPLREILEDYPGISYSLEGEQNEQRESVGALLRWYGLALFAVYALLAVPLRSYTQPLLIMGVIPFGLIGAIGGHLLTGRSLSFMSVLGIIALSGVVVNSSLVLVDFVNRQRREGVELLAAVREASLARFRPILLTSLTTFAGLAPLMLERSVQAQFLIPMAVSLAFGVLLASGITLLTVPSAYLILEDLRGLRLPRR